MIRQFLIKHNIINGKFFIEAFIYVDKDGKPVDISNTIKWLQSFTIECKNKDKNKRAFEMLTYKYPQYAGYFNLY